MSRILISIMSKHTLPNYLLIRQMEGQYDELLFITTPEAERTNRDTYLEEALHLDSDKAVSICVDGTDYRKTLADLKEKWEVRHSDKYVVNLTGGTKMMALAVHDYFQNFDTEFYYVPIEKNTYYNLSTGTSESITIQIPLKEYLTLYGIKYSCIPEDQFSHSQAEAELLYNEVCRNHFHLTAKLRYAQEASTQQLRKYYSGEWFEQFTYFRLKEAFHLKQKDIACSLKIFREGDTTNDNEIDVAFIFQNQLYVVECKVSMFGDPGISAKETIDKYLYKLAAISKDFGLQVKPYIFTLHRSSTLTVKSRQAFNKRCDILGIMGFVRGRMFSDLKNVISNKQTLQL